MTALNLAQERKDAEAEYTTSAFNYARDPIGSYAWGIFWKGWQARAALAQSPVSNEGLERDAARLTWMQKNLIREASMRFPDGSFKSVNAWSIASAGTDLREAIDAAIAAANKGTTS